MPERDLRVAYRAGFEDALDVVQEIMGRTRCNAGACRRRIADVVGRIRSSRARRILEDVTE